MEKRTKVVPVELANGTVIQVEVSTRTGEEDIASTTFSFAGASAAIEDIAQELQHMVERAKPHKASIEFGLELAVESGQLTTLLVKGAGTASLKITLEWEQESRPTKPHEDEIDASARKP